MRKKLIFIVSLIFLIILFANLLFREGLFSNFLKSVLISKMEQELHASVTLSQVRLNLFPPFIEADDITFKENKDTLLPLFKAKHLTVSFSPLSLLTKQPVVHKIQIQNPEIFLIWNENGTTNFEFLSTQPSADAPVPFIFQKVVLLNARLDINHKIEKIHSIIPSLDIRVDADRAMTHFQISGTTKEISFEANNKNTGLFSSSEWKLEISPGQLDFKKLNVDSKEGSIALNGSVNLVARGEGYPFQLAADIHVHPVKQKKYIEGFSVQGKLTGNIGPKRSLSGNMEISRIDIEKGKSSQNIGTLKGHFIYDPQSFRVEQISSNLFGANLDGSFSILKDENLMTFESNYVIRHFSMNRLSEWVSSPQWKYLKERVLDCSGRLKMKNFDPHQMESSGHFHLTQPQAGKTDPKNSFLDNLMISLYSIDSDYQYSSASLTFQNASIIAGDTLVQGNGTYHKDGTIYSAFAMKTEKGGVILSWLGYPQWTGAGEFSGEVGGTLTSPTLQGKGSVREVFFENHSLGAGTTDLKFSERALTFSNAKIIKGTGEYHGEGSIHWESFEKFTYKISARAIHGIPDDIISVFVDHIQLDTRGSGPVTLWGDDKSIRVVGDIDLESGTLYHEAFDSGHVQFEITDKDITFNDTSLSRGSSSVSGSGKIEFEGAYLGKIRTDNLNLDDLNVVNQHLPGFTGAFKGLIEGNGTFVHPMMKISGVLSEVAYRNQKLRNGSVEMTLQDKTLFTDVKFSEHPVQMHGSIDLNYPFNSSLEIIGDQIPIIPLLATTSSLQLSFLTGTISGKMEIAGPLSEPQHLNCSANLTRLDADFGGYPVSNKGDLIFQLKDGNLNIESFHLKGDGTALSISGGLQLFKQLNLFVTGEADLSLLRNFSKGVNYGKGKAFLALNIYDAWSDPKFQGGLNVQEGLIKTTFYPQPINISSLSLFFNERQVFLESLEAALGEGTIQITGKIDINRFKMGHFALIIETKESRFTFFPGWASTVSGTVIFQGDPSVQTLQGEINLSHAIYNKKFDPKPFLKKLTEMRENSRTPIPILGNTRLNIHLLGVDDLRVNNNVARFPFTADLTLKGSLDHPVLIGRLESDSGFIIFYNNTFTLNSISVDFIDPEEIKPLIDLKAGIQIYSSVNGRYYQIDLGLSGSLEELNRTLTADDPTLTETDILSLILAGKKATDVASDPASQQQIAGSFVPLVIESPFEGLFEDITGANRISVDPVSPPFHPGPNTTGGPRVTMEEHLLGDKLLLNYSYIMNPSQDQRVTLDYLLNRHFYLQGIRNEDGTLGGNLKLRFEFK
ncbi:MAG: translocation/assembly module TamB domain-containing protein [Nitrospiria bacterium]